MIYPVLSLLQPWASLVVTGNKKIETRSWNTSHRGLLLIHASLGKNKDGRKVCIDHPGLYPEIPINKNLQIDFDTLPFGAIIGSIEIVDTMRFGEEKSIEYFERTISRDQAHKEFKFGDYTKGRYGFRMINPVVFKTPIPIRGHLGIWKWEGELPE